MNFTKKKKKVRLGDYVTETTTDYEGLVVGITTWLNGCDRIGIQSKERNSETNLPVDIYWVDDTTVEIIEEQKHQTQQDEKGGPASHSSRNKEPKY